LKEHKWKDLPIGAIIPIPSTSLHYKTGGWRSRRPIWLKEKCIQCLRCWLYCPDSAIIVTKGNVLGINYDYCKGCGVCSEVCPKKASAIVMEEEKV